jgi:ribonuclease P protein component
LNNQYTFKKQERITAQKEVDLLFEKGNAFISYPLRIVYVEQKPFSGATVSVLVCVAKKKLKRAVARNRMKRLIRESYRLNKAFLIEHLQEKESGLLIAFLFIGKELCGFKDIEAAMLKVLSILKEKTK